MSKRSKFLAAAERLEHKSVYDAVLAEPFADWTTNVVIRFARGFIPELTVHDAKENPETFFGHLAAFVADLIDRAKAVRVSEIPRGKFGKLLRTEIMAIRKVGPQRLRELKAAAAELPREGENAFFEAYLKSVKNDSVTRALARVEDSNSTKICFFLLCMRLHIEAKKFRSISDLLRLFMKFEELDPKRKAFFDQKPAAKKSLEGQFRDICSDDGLRLRGKGRPPKTRNSTV